MPTSRSTGRLLIGRIAAGVAVVGVASLGMASLGVVAAPGDVPAGPPAGSAIQPQTKPSPTTTPSMPPVTRPTTGPATGPAQPSSPATIQAPASQPSPGSLGESAIRPSFPPSGPLPPALPYGNKPVRIPGGLANPYIRRWYEPAGFAFIGGFGSGAVHGGYLVRFGGSLGSGYRYGGPAPGSDGGSYTGDILPGSLDWWCRDWRWPDSRIVAQDDSISTGFVDPRLMPWLVVAHDDESQSLRGQARELLRRGRYPEAIGAITLYLTEEPDDVLARRDLAIMQIGAGEISSGIDTYYAAVMVDPTVLWLAPTGSMLPGGSSQLAEFAGSVLKVARQDGSVSGYFVAAALYSAAGNRENGLRQLNEANARGFDFGVVQIARRAFTPSPWVRRTP